MPIVYKFDVLKALKEAGYNTSRIRKEKLLSESTLQKLRNREMVSISNIDIFCRLLHCQPGDILKYLDDPFIVPPAPLKSTCIILDRPKPSPFE